MDDNEITAIAGWPTEPEMAKFRAVASAAVAAERERWSNAAAPKVGNKMFSTIIAWAMTLFAVASAILAIGGKPWSTTLYAFAAAWFAWGVVRAGKKA